MIYNDLQESILALLGRRDKSPEDALRPLIEAHKGEPDLFGNIRGGDPRTHFPGVRVEDWEWVGNYAIRFIFSDGHQSGLFPFGLLRSLGEEVPDPDSRAGGWVQGHDI